VGEEDVAGEDGDGVVPAGVDALGAAPHGRLVHDIVVVERGEVHELHRGGGRDDLVGVPVGELRGQEREEGTESLATGLDQV
jgi:hypothetical protein